MFCYALVLCFCVLIGQSSSSAIPMWEYLSTQEKTSFLYSIFASQVESYCESSPSKNCNVELLKYGLNQLKHLSEEYLDAMDPYQRGSNKIIWQTIMEGHPMVKINSPPSPYTTSSSKPNSYDDQSLGGDIDFGSQAAASAKIDNVYRLPAPQSILDEYHPSTTNIYPHKVDSHVNTFNNNFGKGRPFTKLQEQYSAASEESKLNDSYEHEAPLTGPMVVKVYPDGTPVKENVPLPQDEDLRQYRLSKVKLPNY